MKENGKMIAMFNEKIEGARPLIENTYKMEFKEEMKIKFGDYKCDEN